MGGFMNIEEFYNLVVVVKCPKCGEDPNNMQIKNVDDDSFTVKCNNCSTEFKTTNKIEIL